MKEIEIPGGTQLDVKGNEVTTKGSLGSNTRKFNDALLIVSKEGSKLTIKSVEHKKLKSKAENAVGSFAKEVKNDIAGVNKYYEINMQLVFAHFPATVEVKGDTVFIKNLIGERAARKCKILGTTKVEVKGQNIRLYGTMLDTVSQTASNLMRTCKIRFKDNRVFQDGIYYALE